MAENKMLQAQCRQLLETHAGTLEFVINEINDEISRQQINGDTAFEYAKETVRRQGIKEGLLLLSQRINKHAEKG